MSFDFTGRWKSSSIAIPRGQRVGDLWTISGRFGARQRYFAVNFLASGSSDVPMQFVPENSACFCTRRYQGNWSGGGASGPQRPFDTNYRGSTCPSGSSAGKVVPGAPFHLQIKVVDEGYECTLRADEQDENPVVVCYAHRDPVSKADSVSLTCETYDEETVVTAFTLFRETLVLTLHTKAVGVSTARAADEPSETEQGLVIVCTNCAGDVVTTLNTAPNTTLSSVRTLIEANMGTVRNVVLVLSDGRMLDDECDEVIIEQLAGMGAG